MTDATSGELNIPPRSREAVALDRAVAELRNAVRIAEKEMAVAVRRNDALVANIWRQRAATWSDTIADIQTLRGEGR